MRSCWERVCDGEGAQPVEVEGRGDGGCSSGCAEGRVMRSVSQSEEVDGVGVGGRGGGDNMMISSHVVEAEGVGKADGGVVG